MFADTKPLFRVSTQAHFEWTGVIELGNAKIDEQHYRMFLLADALIESLVTSGADNVGRDPAQLLQAFIDFSFHHFRFEEDLMSSVRYPRMRQHANKHGALLAEFAKYHHAFQLGHYDVAHITKFLRNWIFRHIDETDRKMVDWIRSHEPPAGK